MSTSIRQKITLFTLVPAIIFYSLVTVIYLYYTFRAASAEVSRRHLHQSLQYSAVVEGNVKEVMVAARALQLHLKQENGVLDNHLIDYLNNLFYSSKVVTGVGVIHVPDININSGTERSIKFWNRNNGRFISDNASPPYKIPYHQIESLLNQPDTALDWHTDASSKDVDFFRTSLLLPLSTETVLRVDIDGARLIQPLVWLGDRTRLIMLNENGIAVYANSISMPRLRNLDQFITAGPCQGFSKINVTSENEDLLQQFIANPVRPYVGNEPCGIYREALERVTRDGQSINFRVVIRNDRKWVTATPVPSTQWYLSISILEEDILAPLIHHITLSISLIALAMILTLMCLWAVSGRITRPLHRLQKEMNAYAGKDGGGSGDYRDEAVSLSRSFLQLKTGWQIVTRPCNRPEPIIWGIWYNSFADSTSISIFLVGGRSFLSVLQSVLYWVMSFGNLLAIFRIF